MRILDGQALHGQITIGNLHFFRRLPPVLEQHSHRSGEEEENRYLQARSQSVLQLAALYDRAREEVGDKTASIFAIHAMLLEDEEYNREVREMIRAQGVTAEYAVYTVGERVAQTFAGMDSAYMRERGADIQDISRRIALELTHACPGGCAFPQPAILVAENFLPSEVMELRRSNLLGLISTRDGLTSHTAQLLRAYHIPAMVGVDLDPRWEGRLVLMDGFAQKLYLEPDRVTMEKLRQSYQTGGKPETAGI